MGLSPKTRILLIAPSMEIVGGQSVQAAQLLARLRGEPSLDVYFLPNNPRWPRFLQPLRRVKYVRTAISFLLYAASLLRHVRRADIVHVFSAGLWAYYLCSIPALGAARLYGRKILLHYHDGQIEEHLARFPHTAGPTLRKFDLFVSPSGFVVDVLARRGIPARAIRNLLDFGNIPFRARADLLPRFMTNRGLEPVYNVPCILRAFALIERRWPDATLTVAHDGPCRASLERMAQELNLRGVTFTGRVPYEQVAALYDAADIYLTSSNFDCMPGSILESFASGLPVVATNVGGVPYIATDGRTALLVGPDDHEAMAAACFRLLENPDLAQRLIAAAREDVKKYTWEAVRDQWMGAYGELSETSASRRTGSEVLR